MTPIPTLRGVHADVLTERLEQINAEPRRSGDSIRARGVCHGGEAPDSLSFQPTEDGRSWSAHCFKGCPRDEIVSAVTAPGKLPTADGPVADWTVQRTERGERPGFFDAAEHKRVRDDHAALLARPDLVSFLADERRISEATIKAEFIGWRDDEKRFTLAYGSPFEGDERRVYQRDRWQPPEHRTDAPKLLAEKGRARWLYFPAPWLLADGAILTEGAMDALAVVSAGLPAIAAPSATGWNTAWTAVLKRLKLQKLYLPADADNAGQAFVRKVADALKASGIEVVPVELPGLEPGGDVTDFLRGFEAIEHGGRALLQLCEDAEPKEDGLHFIDAADVRQEPQEPLLLRWGQRVPERAVTLLLGREGRGKTALACLLAADVSVGGLGNPPRPVLFLSHEDGASVIASRLEAAGADMNRVKILSHVQRDGRRDGFRLPRDAAALEAAVRQHRPALIVLGGSLMSHVAAGLDSHRQTDMRAVIEPLHDVAQRYGPAVVAVVHPNKSRTADPGHSITGSAATVESARSALLLEVEGDDDAALAVAHFKSSNSAREETLTFSREEVTLPSGIKTVRLVKTGTTKLTAVELISKQLQRTAGDSKASKREQAKKLLEVLLGDQAPHPAKEIKAALQAAGISESTAERAKADLNVQTTSTNAVPPVRFWTLPSPLNGFQRSQLEGTEGTGETPENTGDSASAAAQSPQGRKLRGLDSERPNPFAAIALNGTDPKEHR